MDGHVRPYTRKHAYSRQKASSGKNLIPLRIAVSYVCGLFVGILYTILINGGDFSQLLSLLSGFFEGSTSYGTANGNLFFESFLKYGKLMLAFWVLGFSRPGFAVSLALFAFRGISTGFSASAMIKGYGVEGAYNVILLLLLQNAVLVPAYGYMIYSGRSFYRKNLPLYEYFITLAIGVTCVALAGLIEVYVLPGLAGFL